MEDAGHDRSVLRVAASFLVTALVATSAAAQSTPPPRYALDLVLRYEVLATNDSCPDRAAVVGLLRSRLGTHVFDTATDRIAITIARNGGRLEGTLGVDTGRTHGSRVVPADGSSCTSLIDAMLAIAEVAVAEESTHTAPSGPRTTAIAEPLRDDEEPHERPRARIVPAREGCVVGRCAGPLLGFAFGFDGFVRVGVLPTVTIGAEAVFEVGLDATLARFILLIAIGAERTPVAAQLEPGLSLEGQLTRGTLGGCVEVGESLRFCVRGAAGYLETQTTGSMTLTNGTAFGELGLDAAWRFNLGRFFLLVGGGVSVPFVRVNYLVGTRVAATSAAAVGHLGFGLSYSF